MNETVNKTYNIKSVCNDFSSSSSSFLFAFFLSLALVCLLLLHDANKQTHLLQTHRFFFLVSFGESSETESNRLFYYFTFSSQHNSRIHTHTQLELLIKYNIFYPQIDRMYREISLFFSSQIKINTFFFFFFFRNFTQRLVDKKQQQH